MLSVHSSDPDAMDVDSRKKKKDADVSAVRMALECANSVLQARIISNPNDMMGILLFGTEQTKSVGGSGASANGGFAHCYVLMDLDVPDADGIKQLKALLEGNLLQSQQPIIPTSTRKLIALWFR